MERTTKARLKKTAAIILVALVLAALQTVSHDEQFPVKAKASIHVRTISDEDKDLAQLTPGQRREIINRLTDTKSECHTICHSPAVNP